MSEIRDDINVGTALRLLDGKKPAPTATCSRDGEPLIGTFRYPGAEFVCMVCGSTYGFLSPRPADTTPELDARYKHLRELFAAGVEPGSVASDTSGDKK